LIKFLQLYTYLDAFVVADVVVVVVVVVAGRSKQLGSLRSRRRCARTYRCSEAFLPRTEETSYSF
jgi:hypothetical protein